MAEFGDLKGKILSKVERVEYNEIIFTCTDGVRYKMFHEQDCCEDVFIEDVNGDPLDLINTEILVADEKSSTKDTDCGSETWTFYTIRTMKGSVDIRWYGNSNGCYSEKVDFIKMN